MGEARARGTGPWSTLPARLHLVRAGWIRVCCGAEIMSLSATEQKARIAAHARSLGFDVVGFTTAAPPPHAAAFARWLAAGWHGEMQYLARRAAERLDPARLLPGARSVIVVAQNSAPAASAANVPGSGRVARYAQAATDYHITMGARLEQLAALIRQLGGLAKWYVDTGPVLERDLAQRAGIGFVGKHTNLISRQWGNWLLLGEVVTTLELPADPPEREYCGACTRCLRACPTGAIVGPYQLDARRCISYLTVELKGSIPVELRPLIGERIFGCDDCLEACPWNRFARPAVIPRPWPLLVEMLRWDERRFSAFFRHSPVARLKHRRFLRNLCVVAGNQRNAAARPALERLAAAADPLIREHAAWALARL